MYNKGSSDDWITSLVSFLNELNLKELSQALIGFRLIEEIIEFIMGYEQEIEVSLDTDESKTIELKSKMLLVQMQVSGLSFQCLFFPIFYIFRFTVQPKFRKETCNNTKLKPQNKL
ncbi:hypothetical protein H5410_022921 [Solanum commersonii]|uniref:Uncharacterized protein n=1 Tax=Solanum commersonii TaxID=4109 RepID=A0A9J5ZIE8_SOLCO|nr:hypothetical protein H5410_022921 [Solanum commersonii]